MVEVKIIKNPQNETVCSFSPISSTFLVFIFPYSIPLSLFFSRSLSFSLSLSPAPGPSGPGASFTRPFCPAGGPPEGTARGGRFPGIFTVTRSRSISLPWTFCMYSCRVKGQRSQTASDRTLSNAGTYSDSQILSSLLFSKPSGEKFKIA